MEDLEKELDDVDTPTPEELAEFHWFVVLSETP
jgi:hypothetical protein